MKFWPRTLGVQLIVVTAAAVAGGFVMTAMQNSPLAASISENSPVVGTNGYFDLQYTGSGSAATVALHYVSSVLTGTGYVTALDSTGTTYKLLCHT